jgi:hypothetical protein
MKNTLYYGDNLEILRRYIDDESVDLTYLDPPFNSNADYNVLFREHGGAGAAAQIKAFGDTWEWNIDAARSFEEVVEAGGRVSATLQAFRQMLGDSDMLAYLAMMAPRLIELHRVLKATGSLYLHCDPTASHYLKIMLDAIFDPQSFRMRLCGDARLRRRTIQSASPARTTSSSTTPRAPQVSSTFNTRSTARSTLRVTMHRSSQRRTGDIRSATY